MDKAAALAIPPPSFRTINFLSPSTLPTPPVRIRSYSRNSRTTILSLTRCSAKPDVDSDSTTNRNSNSNSNSSIDFDSNSKPQYLSNAEPNQPLKSGSSSGLVFSLGPENSWDSGEIGSPVVKRFIGDNEERWYMWYHGRRRITSVSDSDPDSIGLSVSSDGVHWTSEDNVRLNDDSGLVMKNSCSDNWWAFDNQSVRPSEMVIMSTPMYSAVYWLYYTGFSFEEVDAHNLFGRDSGRTFKSLPGLACSQDGKNWARIEGDHHSGALLDVGSENEWDSLFISSPLVIMHENDDFRMYYHSFDLEEGRFSIGLARSRDGIRWVKMGKIEIEGGRGSGCFDELGAKNPCVVKNIEGENYVMAYEGISGNGVRSIGMAESRDGLRGWKKVTEECVLKGSENGGWDNGGVGSPCLVHMEGGCVDEWRLYYEGVGHGGKTGIGMAVCDGSSVERFRRWEGFL